jgi:hypothetical protein
MYLVKQAIKDQWRERHLESLLFLILVQTAVFLKEQGLYLVEYLSVIMKYDWS